MRELKIVFTKSKKKFPIGSWAIRWWTGQEYSHVAREVIRKDWGAGYYQASEGNVNYEHESVFFTKHKIVKEYTLMVSEELEMEIRKACWEDCGKKYGMMQNLGTALVDMGICKDTPWKDGRNCSELMYVKVFKKMIPELDYNPDTIKPHQIEEIISNHFEVKEDGCYYLTSN